MAGCSTEFGLGQAFSYCWPSASPASRNTVILRSTMVTLGAAILACGASPQLYNSASTLFQKLEWTALCTGIIRVAEYSKWFFTIINATRDLHKKLNS
ncbi:hypothetical protein GGR51DRAFT_561152 [Nemania sp. FL0031]|nr:hypothetical protein GGR51DRAFT_561152 [Nemania sp. FL0031]